MTFSRMHSGLQEYRYAYILTVHTEEYSKFILASIIFDVLHPIPNNQLEFQLVSTFLYFRFDLFTTLVTKSWTPSRSRNQEITDLRFKISLLEYLAEKPKRMCRAMITSSLPSLVKIHQSVL